MYEEEYFPGKVLKVNDNEYYVSVMVMSGVKYWKWPKNPDKCWYLHTDIIKKIEEPSGSS